MNRTETVVAVGLAGLWAATLVYADRLPPEVPTHFGLDGRPDAWGASTVSWYLVPTLATVLGIGTLLIGRWVARNPKYINLPAKERILELPERYRGPVEEAIRDILGWVAVEMVVLFSVVQRATWVGAQGGDTEALILSVLLLSILTSPILIFLFSTRISTAVDRGWQRARAEGHSPT